MIKVADNSRAINRVFTRKVISDLVQDGKSDVFDYVVKRYVEDPSGKTLTTHTYYGIPLLTRNNSYSLYD